MDQSLQLILVSLASRTNILSYDELMSSLNIPNERELEEFIIDSIYHDVIKGRLNPKQRRVEITDWNSQQVGDVNLEFMQQTLGNWIENCSSFIKTLHEELENSKEQTEKEKQHEKDVEEEVARIKKGIISPIDKIILNTTPQDKSFKNDAKRYKGSYRMRRNN